MHLDRSRAKKLILAFHFQFADQTRWKCEECRAAGLEARRRCGFLAPAQDLPQQVVWSRRGVYATRCPKSEVSATSLSMLEKFWSWKLAGGRNVLELDAREAEAFWILEFELRKELETNG